MADLYWLTKGYPANLSDQHWPKKIENEVKAGLTNTKMCGLVKWTSKVTIKVECEYVNDNVMESSEYKTVGKVSKKGRTIWKFIRPKSG